VYVCASHFRHSYKSSCTALLTHSPIVIHGSAGCSGTHALHTGCNGSSRSSRCSYHHVKPLDTSRPLWNHFAGAKHNFILQYYTNVDKLLWQDTCTCRNPSHQSYSLEEQTCQISSRSDLNRRALRLLLRSVAPTRTIRARWVATWDQFLIQKLKQTKQTKHDNKNRNVRKHYEDRKYNANRDESCYTDTKRWLSRLICLNIRQCIMQGFCSSTLIDIASHLSVVS